MQNTYFDQETYETEIELEVNEDVLDRIYSDGVSETDMLPIEFFFLTDTEEKALKLKECFLQNYPDYSDLEISDYEGDTQLRGLSMPIEMSLNTVNIWNIEMWDLGYQFDCRLDGWQVQSR